MELKVFTLNCWGIPMVSKYKNTRINAIAEALENGPYDIICLQEVWCESDYILIKERLFGTLPYSHYFYSGVFGSGVCIFSKHPIINTYFHKFMMNGYVHKLHHGDWFGGKGVGLCQILWNGLFLNIYSAHLHAEYDRFHDEYLSCRIVQAYDTAQFINFTSASADIVILGGDLNCETGDLTYKLMTSITQLSDAFFETTDSAKACTNLNLLNSFTPKSRKKKGLVGPRIDYILFKSCYNTDIEVKSYKQPFPKLIPDMNISYSDHEAITATLIIRKVGDIIQNTGAVGKLDNEMLLAGIDEIDTGLSSVSRQRIYYWILTLILLCIIIGSLFYEPEFVSLLHFLRILLTLAMCYTLIMATFWNMIESNTLYATKLALQTNLRSIDILKKSDEEPNR